MRECEDFVEEVIRIVRLMGIGQNVERLVSAEIANVGEAEEKLQSFRGRPEHIGKQIELLAVQLHHIERVASFIDTKILRIVAELNQLQGHLTAHHKQLSVHYKQLKFQQRTGENPNAAPQMQHYGAQIRTIEAHIAHIKTIKRNIINGIKRDMSTMRYIALKAE